MGLSLIGRVLPEYLLVTHAGLSVRLGISKNGTWTSPYNNQHDARQSIDQQAKPSSKRTAMCTRPSREILRPYCDDAELIQLKGIEHSTERQTVTESHWESF